MTPAPPGRRPLVMGVLNVTPDSFSDGGLYETLDLAVAHGVAMATEGADVIDVGGESSRPGAEPVPTGVELEPVLSEEMINETAFHHMGDLEAHGRVDVMADLTCFDIERLHILITRHARLTGSARAKAILADWKGYAPKFRKVMPVEFRRALQELRAQEEAARPKIAARA